MTVSHKQPESCINTSWCLAAHYCISQLVMCMFRHSGWGGEGRQMHSVSAAMIAVAGKELTYRISIADSITSHMHFTS